MENLITHYLMHFHNMHDYGVRFMERKNMETNLNVVRVIKNSINEILKKRLVYIKIMI